MIRQSSFKKLNNLSQLISRKSPLIVHAESGWFEHILDGGCDFFQKLGESAHDKGFKPLVVHAEDIKSYGLLATDHLQIVVGPKRPQGRRIYHAQPSYLQGFWYLDPKGFHWNSSLADQKFVPQNVNAIEAAYFFNGVSNYLIKNNKSKRPQSPKNKVSPSPAGAAVFLQDIEKYRKPVHFLTTEEMITQTCETIDGKVYVKLHPLQDNTSRNRVERHCELYPNAVVTNASIHDLIAASEIIVSQNSAVGFEALMYKKPVITCAQCDYHQASLVSRSSLELRENLQRASSWFQDYPYEKFFYWFLGLNMLEPQKDDFAERAWVKLMKH